MSVNFSDNFFSLSSITAHSCGEIMSKCNNGYQCVLDYVKFDGRVDCADGSYENPDICVVSMYIWIDCN